MYPFYEIEFHYSNLVGTFLFLALVHVINGVTNNISPTELQRLSIEIWVAILTLQNKTDSDFRA